MGTKVEAIFVKDSDKKNSVLFREEGLTGDWKLDPAAKISTSIYVMRTALDALGNNSARKIKITVEVVD